MNNTLEFFKGEKLNPNGQEAKTKVSCTAHAVMLEKELQKIKDSEKCSLYNLVRD